MQELEYSIHKHGHSALTREKAFETVNALLKWHGIPEIKDSESDTLSWADYSTSWLDDIERTLEVASYRHHRTHLNSFTKFLDDESLLLRHVSRRQVQDWYNELSESGLMPKTTMAYLKTIRRIFADAISDELIRSNPAVKIKTNAIHSRKKEPFTVKDLKAIRKQLETLPHAEEWDLVFLFGLCLGARLNDCSIRKWSEIDLGKNPHISYIPGKTKKHDLRVNAPIVDPLLSKLKSMKKGKSDFITPTLAEIPSNGRGNLSTMFTDAMKEAGVSFRTEKGHGERGITWISKSFHSFRHTLPSLMAAADVPDQIRMAIIGHSRLATHLGYTHHDEDQMRGALEKGLKGLSGI